MEVALSILTAITQLLLGYQAFHVSTGPHQAMQRLFFLAVAVLGFSASIYATFRAHDAADRNEAIQARIEADLRDSSDGVAELRATIKQMASQLDRLTEKAPTAAAAPPVATAPSAPTGANPASPIAETNVESSEPQTATTAQRRQVLSRLTTLYMLSHDNISGDMMAGLELPPKEWLNEQLEKYAKTWRVREVNGPNVVTYNVPR